MRVSLQIYQKPRNDDIKKLSYITYSSVGKVGLI